MYLSQLFETSTSILTRIVKNENGGPEGMQLLALSDS